MASELPEWDTSGDGRVAVGDGHVFCSPISRVRRACGRSGPSILWGIEFLIRLDHFEQAAVFDGIADTFFTPEYRGGIAWAHQDAAIATARTAFGAEQYDQAFQTGAAMTYDQAIDHTPRVLDAVIAETDEPERI